jgi:hypothetical protein
MKIKISELIICFYGMILGWGPGIWLSGVMGIRRLSRHAFSILALHIPGILAFFSSGVFGSDWHEWHEIGTQRDVLYPIYLQVIKVRLTTTGY